LQLIAVHADGRPLQQTLLATVSVARVEWQTLRALEAGHAAGYRSEPLFTNLLRRTLQTSAVEQREQAWDIKGSQGSGLQFTPPEAGTYLLEAVAADEAGRPVVSAMLIHASGPEQPAWNYRNPVKIDLVADKPAYQPGDIATLLVQTPIAGQALVTVERDEVRRAFVQEVSRSASTIRIPIRAEDAPNVFVSVLIVRGADQSPLALPAPEYRLGYCQLLVTNPATRLHVSLQPSSTSYRPADDIEVVATITDAAARPVADAALTLFAVDEGVLRLSGPATIDPHAYFHQQRPLAVECRLSLRHLFPEEPSARDFGNKGYLVGGGGQARVRKNFAATAFWADDLRTDAAGRVVVRFRAPDSLTRYRLVAVAHAREEQFGSAESALTVDKPLLLEPALPQFATLGDQLDARAVVHNLMSEPADVEVSLGLDKLARCPQPLQRVLAVPANGSVKVEFPLEMVGLGPAVWTWRARFVEGGKTPRGCTGFADAVQSTLSIGPLAPLLRETQTFRHERGEADLLARANPQLLEGTGTLTLRLSNTRLSELGEAASHLLHYPYGCVEQTSSSLLPWLVLKRFPLIAPARGSNSVAVARAIEAGINRLLSMQTSEGGLGYWPGGREPMYWGSAYGGLTLALAQKAGAPVPPERFARLLRFLQDGLKENSPQPSTLSEHCLALLALAMAGRAEPAYHEKLFQNRAQLSGEDAALLAVAVGESGGPPSMLAELLQARAAVPRQADAFGCDARALSIRLLAWLRHRPTDPEVERTLLALFERTKNAHWNTTQANAWALLAMADFAERVEAVSGVDGSFRCGDRSETFALPQKPAVQDYLFSLNGGRPQLFLSNAGPQRLYANWTMEGRPRVGRQPGQDAGFSFTRQYFKLSNEGLESPTNAFRVGERVLVKLRLTSRAPAQYVAIDDPLPSVFEAINPNFRSRAGAGPGIAASPEWFSDFREIRADRVLFFRNYLPAGTYEIQYLARVRAGGRVTAPPAKVEEMYHPERFGLAESLSVTSHSFD
jgi:uncharacterized protein YfaS (alpha-2-macroglobulin family)